MRSDILSVVHETAQDLADAGAFSRATMREFDAACLPVVKSYSAADIKKIRTGFMVSQAVFAVFLNTTVSTIQKWESGEKKPNGMSAKLLNIVESKGLDVLL